MTDIHLVGNYAVSPHWGDGHSHRVLHVRLLRDRCPCAECTAAAAASRPAHGGRARPSPATSTDEGAPMIVATTPFIAGHRIVETKGQVFGLVVRSRGFSGNLIAGLRSLGGGEIHEYTSLLEDTRRQALDRLVKNATLMGGNAVVSMRFDSSELAGDDVRDRRLRHGGRRRARRGAPQPPTE